MDSGMYAALAGSIASMKRLDIISNNLANSATHGFKRDNVSFEALLADSMAGSGDTGLSRAVQVSAERSAVDFSQGGIIQTGNSLDFAIKGDGFFVVRTPQGVAYTRQGSFHLGENGRLISGDGYEVQGGGGGITLPAGSVAVDERGRISVDGREVATLDIVDFPKPYLLEKVGSNLLASADQEQPPFAATGSSVQQGALEGSNVNAVKEMAAMIENSRFFEACEKIVRSYDEIKGKAVNELGRL